MSRQFRTRTMQPARRRPRRRVALTALIVVAVAAARPLAPSGQAAPGAAPTAAAHPCLVMTGSGDPAFVKNFNPYTATGLPSGQFVRGAFYERLIVSPEGGKPTLPWLARSWKWSNGNKTLTLQHREGRQVVGRQAADRRPTSSTASRPASRTRRWTSSASPGPDTNIASIKAKGPYKVVINLKTPDSQFIAATLNGEFVDPAAHLVEGQGPRDVHEPEARRLRPVHAGSRASRRRTTSLARTRSYWQAGTPKITASSTCRRRRTTRRSR